MKSDEETIVLVDTDFHKRQALLSESVTIFDFNTRSSSGRIVRFTNLLRLVFFVLPKYQKIVMPRSLLLEFLLVYNIFRKSKKIEFLSDGLFDFIHYEARLGGFLCVPPKSMVAASKRQIGALKRAVVHSKDGPIAYFTKGKSEFQVEEFIKKHFVNCDCVVNPPCGEFSMIIIPASTLIFELTEFGWENVVVVSHTYDTRIWQKKRRKMYAQYEQVLSDLGLSVRSLVVE